MATAEEGRRAGAAATFSVAAAILDAWATDRAGAAATCARTTNAAAHTTHGAATPIRPDACDARLRGSDDATATAAVGAAVGLATRRHDGPRMGRPTPAVCPSMARRGGMAAHGGGWATAADAHALLAGGTDDAMASLPHPAAQCPELGITARPAPGTRVRNSVRGRQSQEGARSH